MQATLIVERIDRRLAVDSTSDADWLLTRVDAAEGRLRIVESMRYTDEDVQEYGEAQVRAWIADDHRRHDDYQRGNWWFVDACATAIIGVFIGEERISQFGYCSMTVGGIESDAPRDYLDEMTETLVTEVKEELVSRGFSDLDEVETPYLLSESWVAAAI